MRGAYSSSLQSRPAGQRSRPVTGWWKPLFVLTFRDRGGSKGASRGVIQSTTMPFKLLVSSDLAVDTPFWSFCRWKGFRTRNSWVIDVPTPPSPWRPLQSPSWDVQRDEVPRLRVFDKPGAPSGSCVWERRVNKRKGINYCTNSNVSNSSATSSSSPIRTIALVNKAWTLHIAYTVLPKCRPWWTRGSPARLRKIIDKPTGLHRRTIDVRFLPLRKLERIDSANIVFWRRVIIRHPESRGERGLYDA